MTPMTRAAVLAALVGGGVLLTIVYGMRRGEEGKEISPSGVSADSFARADAARRPYLLFRHTRQDAAYGRLMLVSVDDWRGVRHDTGLTCDRVHLRAGVGVCLVTRIGVTNDFQAIVFNDRFERLRSIRLNGVPSHVKVIARRAIAQV